MLYKAQQSPKGAGLWDSALYPCRHQVRSCTSGTAKSCGVDERRRDTNLHPHAKIINIKRKRTIKQCQAGRGRRGRGQQQVRVKTITPRETARHRASASRLGQKSPTQTQLGNNQKKWCYPWTSGKICDIFFLQSSLSIPTVR